MAFGQLAGIDSSLRGIASAATKVHPDFDVVVLVPESEHRPDEGNLRFVPYRRWSRAARAQRLFRYRTIASVSLRDYDVAFLRYPTSVDLNPLALFRNPIARRIA